MSSFIQQTAVVPADTKTLTVEQKGDLIAKRAHDIINNASLELVSERMPQYVPVINAMVAELDYNQPLTIAQAGSWALKDQADVGLSLLTKLQQGPSRDVLEAVDQFEKDLRSRITPLQARIDKRAGHGFIGRIVAAGKRKIKPLTDALANNVVSRALRKITNGRGTQSKKLHNELDQLRADDLSMADIVHKTMGDTVKIKGLLADAKHVPHIVEQEVSHTLDTHTETVEKLFMTLVSIKEYQKKLNQDEIPVLEEKALSPTALPADIDKLQRAQKSNGLLETRRTDLADSILSISLQRGMASEMAHLNASSAIEMERLESIGLPRMIGMLGTLALQQRTGELAITTRTVNHMLGSAAASTAQGFAKVLEYSKQADLSKLDAAQAVVLATSDTLTAIHSFREHQQTLGEKQRQMQDKLADAVGQLQAAATRMSPSVPAEKQLPTEQPSTQLSAPSLLQVTTTPANSNNPSTIVEAPTRDIGSLFQAIKSGQHLKNG